LYAARGGIKQVRRDDLCKSEVTVKTSVVFFPFDLFGSGGTATGVQLLADELREILDDNRRETVATRARCYTEQLKLREFTFETLADYSDWRARARQAVRQASKNDEFLLWISGNHLGALPVYDELSSHGDKALIVQFDAHLDIHHFADCTSEMSHGNFLLHCDGPLPPIVNLGHRELLLTPEYIAEHYRHTFSAADLAINPQPALDYLHSTVAATERVFLDIDCDVFDPLYFPAVTQPVPFGLSPPQLLRLLDAVWTPQLRGMMLSEFEPGRDQNDRSLATLVWLLEYVLLKRYEAA
jgi:arginase family enzyme